MVYPGRDLEAMSFAVNYHKWILDEFRPFLGRRIVEVGAGTGSFSEMLLSEKPETLTLIEPSAMFDQLTANLAGRRENVELSFHNHTFREVAGKLAAPDSIIYVNVLEHIEDDLAELKMISETLGPRGRCFIFVPALMSLYGEFDRRIGHFRRYDKAEIEEKCGLAGFKILESRYFDFFGVIPWWVKYKLFRSDSLGSGSVELYDKIAVPVTRMSERVMRPPLGKNILLIAEKSS